MLRRPRTRPKRAPVVWQSHTTRFHGPTLMTDRTPAPQQADPPRHPRGRGLASTALAVVFVVMFAASAGLVWAHDSLFDGHNFADGVVRLLDSGSVRAALADEITTTLVTEGPSELASFQTILRPTIDQLLTTDVFRGILRDAVLDAHHEVLTKDGNTGAVNLSQALGVLSSSLELSNPDLAKSIPSGSDPFLVKLDTDIRDAQPWKISEWLAELTVVGIILSVAIGAGVILLDPDRRRGVFKLGAAVAASGVILVGVTFVLPVLAESYGGSALVQRALHDGARILVSSLRMMAVWITAIGVILCAVSTASRPSRGPLSLKEIGEDLRARLSTHKATTPRGIVMQALLLVGIGLVVINFRDAVAPFAVFLLGLYVVYLGTVQLLVVVGRVASRTTRKEISDDIRETSFRPRKRVVIGSAIALVAIVFIVGFFSTSAARENAKSAVERKCNGDARLCDRPLDQVAFAGSHNSMSAASDPGWLFAEQSHGIPSQLAFGVRAFLVKTHYGIPTPLDVTGTKLVVTDRVAEFAAHPKAAEDQLPPAQQERAKELAATSNVDPNLRDVYLCHVYCEYGSLKFTTALGYIRQFLATNPDEVIILFIGDYVSTADTEKAFREAKIFDRLWEYDPTAPMPTLGQMIDAKRNILVLSENSGQPPAWNTPGYGIFQDTPFTFPTEADLDTPGSPAYTGTATVSSPVDDTIVEPAPDQTTGTTLEWNPDWTGVPSCRPNRGTPDSPLFQINHFVTPAGAAPTIAQAKAVNAYDVLMPRVDDCRTQRGRFPTIVGVNFAEVGDLLRVVDDLNGVR